MLYTLDPQLSVPERLPCHHTLVFLYRLPNSAPQSYVCTLLSPFTASAYVGGTVPSAAPSPFGGGP